MKNYIIENTNGGSYDVLFLVKANNKKEALDILWEQMNYNNQEPESMSGYKPYYKKEFSITDVNDLFSKNGNCVVLY